MATAESKVRGMLGKTLRTTLSDGRIVIGSLECCDGNKNLLLTNCVQVNEDGETVQRIGYVMVPGKHIVRAEVQV